MRIMRHTLKHTHTHRVRGRETEHSLPLTLSQAPARSPSLSLSLSPETIFFISNKLYLFQNNIKISIYIEKYILFGDKTSRSTARTEKERERERGREGGEFPKGMGLLQMKSNGSHSPAHRVLLPPLCPSIEESCTLLERAHEAFVSFVVRS